MQTMGTIECPFSKKKKKECPFSEIVGDRVHVIVSKSLSRTSLCPSLSMFILLCLG